VLGGGKLAVCDILTSTVSELPVGRARIQKLLKACRLCSRVPTTGMQAVFFLEIEMKKRPIRVEGDVAYVPLACGAEAIIDAEDAELVGQYNWSKDSNGYAATNIRDSNRWRTMKMHRLIFGEPEGLFIDHIFSNRLDNRKSELRTCTRAQNMANQGKHSNNLVGYKGVSGRSGRFLARIRHLGEQIYLGTFDTAEDAHEAYKLAAFKYHGEFARTE